MFQMRCSLWVAEMYDAPGNRHTHAGPRMGSSLKKPAF